MKISRDVWERYTTILTKINDTASKLMLEYIRKNPIEDREDVEKWIRYAYALATKYGEAASALAADVYDQFAEAEGASVEPAEVAETASYGDVAKTINGTWMYDLLLVAGTVGRLVKRAGADTVLKNAIRDHAFVAWIPVGETCPFCLSIAAEGWNSATEKALKNGHAKHIHGNCNCQYAVKHKKETVYDSYDEDEYADQFNSAEGRTQHAKINYLRRTGE